MSENHIMETKGLAILQAHLEKKKRKYEVSDLKTFDLKVDDEYAEMKVKRRAWNEFDFISLTDKQAKSLGKELKKIFLVLNVGQPGQEEVIEVDAQELLKVKSKVITHYEWNKGDIKHLRRI